MAFFLSFNGGNFARHSTGAMAAMFTIRHCKQQMHKLLLGSLHNQIPSEDVKKASHIRCCNRKPYTMSGEKKKNRPRHGLFRYGHPSKYYPRPTGLNFCDFGVTDHGWRVINWPLALSKGAHTKDANIFQTPHEALFVVSGQTAIVVIPPCLSISQPLPP